MRDQASRLALTTDAAAGYMSRDAARSVVNNFASYEDMLDSNLARFTALLDTLGRHVEMGVIITDKAKAAQAILAAWNMGRAAA